MAGPTHTEAGAPGGGGSVFGSKGDGSVHSLVSAVAHFSTDLRRRGVPVSLAETAEAVRALEYLDLGDRRHVFLGLRSVLTTSVDDYRPFEDAFLAFWRSVGELEGAERRIPGPSLPREPRPERDPEPPAPTPTVSLERWLRQEGAGADEEAAELRGPSAAERLAVKDFRDFGDDEVEALNRLARRLARKLGRRRGRRWRPARRGESLHLRRTVRRALASGGEMPELLFRERRPRRTRLVALLDVSGSMDLYSRFLLQVLYALQNAFRRVETFAFATGLTRISSSLEGTGWREALASLSAEVRDWSGGTRIGACLEDFAREWPELVDGRTVLLILSDGWDTGDPERLAEVLAELHGRAGKVVWLNPLAGTPGYRPLTRGIQSALPHVDVLAPAHNLKSLEALAEHLTL